MRAHLPANETARLQALAAYHLLDSGAERMFDDLTQLASHICQCPTALIVLVDKDRQWFKSRVGMEARETPRDFAFCAHALLQPDMLVVPDATLDRRFSDNPLVTGNPYIRFYAGAKLTDPAGFDLGTLCVIDRKPRELTEAQAAALERLARQATALAEFRRVARSLSDALERVRVMEGLLAICANCKSIRDDAGAWRQLEEYIEEHSTTNFTHGVCPDCQGKLYPGFTHAPMSAGK